MSDFNPDLTPSRPPPRSRGPVIWLAVLGGVAIALAVALIWRPTVSETGTLAMLENRLSVMALGSSFEFTDRAWREFDGEFELSGGLVMTRSSARLRDADLLEIFRAACGSILTNMREMPERPTERAGLFRLALWFWEVDDNGRLTGEMLGGRKSDIWIENGACPQTEDFGTLTYSTYPGALEQWAVVGMNELTGMPADKAQAAIIFASRFGKVVPPLPFEAGCRAYLFDYTGFLPEETTKIGVIFSGEAAPGLSTVDGFDGAGMIQFFDYSSGTCVAEGEPLRL